MIPPPKKPGLSFRDLMAQAPPAVPAAPGAEDDLRVIETETDHGVREHDTQIIYPEQIIAALADGSRGAVEALEAAQGKPPTRVPEVRVTEAPARPEPAVPPAPVPVAASVPPPPEEERPSDEFNLGLDAEIARLLERTRRYVTPDAGRAEPPRAPDPMVVGHEGFEMPGGRLTPPAGRGSRAPRLLFDEAAGIVEEPTDHLGLLDSMDRRWQDEPTPVGDPRRVSRAPRAGKPPVRPFLQASMTAPLPAEPPKRKASTVPAKAGSRPEAPRVTGPAAVAWVDPPPPPAEPERTSGGTTRRMRESARRVQAAIAPVVASVTPTSPWVTLGILAVSSVWIATGVAAGSVAVAAVGVLLAAPLAVSAVLRSAPDRAG